MEKSDPLSLLLLLAITVAFILIGGLVALNLAGASAGLLFTLVYRKARKRT